MQQDDLFAAGLDAAISEPIPEAENIEPSFDLTAENYYSKEAGLRYWSNSRFGAYAKCPARQYAIETGAFTPEDRKAHFDGGQYAHALFLEPHRRAEFDARFPKIRKTYSPEEQLSVDEWLELAEKTGAKVPGKRPSRAKIMDAIIATGKVDEVPEPIDGFSSEYKWIGTALEAFHRQTTIRDIVERGEHEKILIFTLGGVEWKAMIDNDRPEDAQFDDLKFMKDFKDVWDKSLRKYVAWWERYNYPRQSAVYQVACDQNLEGARRTPNIFGFSKEEITDVQWIQFSDQKILDLEIEFIEQSLPRFIEWSSGEEEAPRCGECDFCRSSKIVTFPFRPTYG